MLMPKPDYEEMMLQISDVMRAANKLRPVITHKEAVLKIFHIVEEASVYEDYIEFANDERTL